ncbi:MAG: hypothetical protein L0Z51_11220 [Candidatus Latescibacteria bacterium]|nr:hypothetical protein [Candidatus Latescibacterota bacterium]
MEQYTFIVQLPFKGRASYTVNLDGRVPLIESFARIVEVTQGAEEEIPIEITTADGRRAEVTWTFALAGEDGDEMLLSPHMSLTDQGVMPNAEIVVEDESNVGAPDPDARFTFRSMSTFARTRATSGPFSTSCANSSGSVTSRGPMRTPEHRSARSAIQEEHEANQI